MGAAARHLVPPDLDRLAEKYASLDLPVLLIWGGHDEIVPPDIGRRLHAMPPRARLRIVEDSGYIPQEEAPEAVVEHLLDFLRTIEPPVTGARGPEARPRTRPSHMPLPHQGSETDGVIRGGERYSGL